MASGGIHKFAATDVLTASQVNDFLMRQTIMRFDDAADRTSQLATQSISLEDGMWSFLLDDESLYYHLDGSWVPFMTPWTAYTPSWTNLTVGSATQVAKYRYIMGDIRVMGYITFAGDTSVTGSIIQTIPNSETASTGWQGGAAQANDTGSRIYPCTIGVTSATTWNWVHAESGNGGIVNATAPFTWGTGDVLTWDFTVGLA